MAVKEIKMKRKETNGSDSDGAKEERAVKKKLLLTVADSVQYVLYSRVVTVMRARLGVPNTNKIQDIKSSP